MSKLLQTIGWIVLGAVVMFFFFRRCGQAKTTPDDILISQAAKKAIDSVKNAYQKDSAQRAARAEFASQRVQLLENEVSYLMNDQAKNENNITLLNSIIRAAKKDSSLPVYILSCDSLVEVSDRLVDQNKGLRKSIENLKAAHGYESALKDTSLIECETAYYSVVDEAIKLSEANDKLISDQKKKGFQVYAGLTGIYSPGYAGAGPELTIKTKRDRLIKASYIVTNIKPIYQVGYSFKISFKK